MEKQIRGLRSTRTHKRKDKMERKEGGKKGKRDDGFSLFHSHIVNTDICSKYCACSNNDPLHEVYERKILSN